jgi:hypothetical protein
VNISFFPLYLQNYQCQKTVLIKKMILKSLFWPNSEPHFRKSYIESGAPLVVIFVSFMSFFFVNTCLRKNVQVSITETMRQTTDRSRYIEKLRELNDNRRRFKEFRTSISVVDKDEDELDEIVEFNLHLVLSRKYLYPRQQYRRGLLTYFEDLVTTPGFTTFNNQSITGKSTQPWLTENEFQQKYRVTRESFYKILEMIKEHPIFSNTDRRGRMQQPPEFQLMTLLKFLGTEGTGNSDPNMRSIFRIGSGSAALYEDRAMQAIRSLRDKVITWPDAIERKQIADRV